MPRKTIASVEAELSNAKHQLAKVDQGFIKIKEYLKLGYGEDAMEVVMCHIVKQETYIRDHEGREMLSAQLKDQEIKRLYYLLRVALKDESIVKNETPEQSFQDRPF